MAQPDHVEIVRGGVDAIKNWRLENPEGRLDLSGVVLQNTTLRGANFRGANLKGIDFSHSELDEADFSGCDLTQACLWDCQLRGAVFDDADVSGSEINESDLSGASLRWTHLEDCTIDDSSFNNADLRNVSGMFASFCRCDFAGANLEDALLSYSNFTAARFVKCNLKSAWFESANLSLADFYDADLGWSHLGQAKLFATNLANASLREAKLKFTTIANVDLSTAKSLETCLHEAPSHIDVATISASRWQIPDAFLSGAGIRGDLLRPGQFPARNEKPELLNKPIKYVLSAYSYDDEAVTTRLISALSESGEGRWYVSKYEALPELADEITLTGDVIVSVVPAPIGQWEFERLVRQVTRREQAVGSRILFPVIVEGSDLESLEETVKTYVERSATDLRGLALGDALDRAISALINAINAIHNSVES